MSLQFTKMHGLGNDFLIINGINQNVTLTPNDIKRLSIRETGVGFDQCLIITASSMPDVDFFYQIYNANGESVGQCGNGARCIARFIEHYDLSKKKILTVATQTTRLTLLLNSDHTVTVNMGIPQFSPHLIPLRVSEKSNTYPISISPQEIFSIHAVSIGNPHAILMVDDVEHAPVSTVGQLICEHALFPDQTNVGFLKVDSSKHISLRVYERGCGETRACGSGAVAAMAAGRLFHHLSDSVEVSLPGGVLQVDWPDISGPIFLSGPATFSYEGQLLFNL
jgi:diaminopimelate epimerase